MIKKNKSIQANVIYEKRIKQCLIALNFLPIGKKGSWHFFKITHSKPNKNETLKNKNPARNKIKENVVNKGGIYVYKKGEKIIYIGIAKELRSRLNAHYNESYKKVSKKNKGKRWHRFFSKNRGKLKIYWKEVEGKNNRLVLEQMLTFVCNPEFVEGVE